MREAHFGESCMLWQVGIWNGSMNCDGYDEDRTTQAWSVTIAILNDLALLFAIWLLGIPENAARDFSKAEANYTFASLEKLSQCLNACPKQLYHPVRRV